MTSVGAAAINATRIGKRRFKRPVPGVLPQIMLITSGIRPLPRQRPRDIALILARIAILV
jgi:hypothetical protein